VVGAVCGLVSLGRRMVTDFCTARPLTEAFFQRKQGAKRATQRLPKRPDKKRLTWQSNSSKTRPIAST
jgi:hypothetical protein